MFFLCGFEPSGIIFAETHEIQSFIANDLSLWVPYQVTDICLSEFETLWFNRHVWISCWLQHYSLNAVVIKLLSLNFYETASCCWLYKGSLRKASLHLCRENNIFFLVFAFQHQYIKLDMIFFVAFLASSTWLFFSCPFDKIDLSISFFFFWYCCCCWCPSRWIKSLSCFSFSLWFICTTRDTRSSLVSVLGLCVHGCRFDAGSSVVSTPDWLTDSLTHWPSVLAFERVISGSWLRQRETGRPHVEGGDMRCENCEIHVKRTL